jgi:hypothetical protein
LSLFANVVADEINAGAPGLADAWLAAWSINDGAERVRSLEAIAAIPDNAPPTIQAIWAQSFVSTLCPLVRKGFSRHSRGRKDDL